MMSTVGAEMVPDTTTALVLAHVWGDRRLRFVWSTQSANHARLLRCMSPLLALRWHNLPCALKAAIGLQ
jgi:hypothetical protein